MGVHIYHYNWNFFDTPSEELYYFLGFVAADGYISNSEIEIGLAKNDIALLERFRNLICPEKPLYKRVKTNSFTLKISCKNNSSLQLLSRLPIAPGQDMQGFEQSA